MVKQTGFSVNNDNRNRGIILLADDEWLVRWSLERALNKEGFDVITAASGEAAIKASTGQKLRWLITDLKMPDMDGFALIEKIRSQCPSSHLLLITAHGTPEIAHKAKDLGICYLNKPFDLDTILTLVTCHEKHYD